ncbi:hypothetical protein K491DRAFT_699857 [Lophiostoma macrostomum CBS 122681]|uniref:Endonuclease/exonuclease/phosphatase domain-containing protein n=1 Tax=Lophiostoma macrostomum CBS 122681 TaxID=1314788 RepID=A0A6A6SI63_9PLEO|nr:hypothetical protein K491DRAFT_699857 [Lophiostoma macrostomum CBS 122681]
MSGFLSSLLNLPSRILSSLNSDPEDALRPQPYYHHDGSTWLSSASLSSPLPPPPSLPNLHSSHLRLISWNIDMSTPFASERMSGALAHLSDLINSTDPSTAVIIFLQEMTSSDLSQLSSCPWIQDRFYITDISTTNYRRQPRYGTTTLIDRRLQIARVYRVDWKSYMGRDGLFVDIRLSPPSQYLSQPQQPQQTKPTTNKTLRLCNTHLDSLPITPSYRPTQLTTATTHLTQPRVAAGILAGDMNANEPFDRTLHVSNDLTDAYLALGGQEDSEEGYTWGYQSEARLRERFGSCRMDKMLFQGGVLVRRFQRMGVGVKVGEGQGEGEGEWVSDHYGVVGDFEGEGWEFA